MAAVKAAYLDRERKRWMRPDARHFVAPGWGRHVKTGSELATVFALYERKYSPEQPRDDRGRWTDEGSGGGSMGNDGTRGGSSDGEVQVAQTGFGTLAAEIPLSRGRNCVTILEASASSFPGRRIFHV